MARLTAAQRQTMLDSPWFGKLPAGPRDEVLDLATLRHVSEGEIVYAKDRPGDAWYGILAGMGVALVSTSRGVMADRDARKQKVGGEVLAYVW